MFKAANMFYGHTPSLPPGRRPYWPEANFTYRRTGGWHFFFAVYVLIWQAEKK